jgi:hypothetical protein
LPYAVPGDDPFRPKHVVSKFPIYIITINILSCVGRCLFPLFSFTAYFIITKSVFRPLGAPLDFTCFCEETAITSLKRLMSVTEMACLLSERKWSIIYIIYMSSRLRICHSDLISNIKHNSAYYDARFNSSKPKLNLRHMQS